MESRHFIRRGLATSLLAALPVTLAAVPRQEVWSEAGLSERQAAAHLLDRFAFGARPGDVDRVVDMGLRTWLERQLEALIDDAALERKLAPLSTLEMSAETIQREFPDPGRVLREAMRSGEMARPPADRDSLDDSEERDMRRQVMAYYREQGYRPPRELMLELMTQKLYRALYGENQLQEVLTDFWFNHFNVSLTHDQARSHLLAYERDAIRPRVLGSFRDLLGATAQHPAMLLYLDNARSSADEERTTTVERRLPGRRFGEERRRRREREEARAQGDDLQRQRPRGLNENYARELLELHTLGVDGGYTQEDVVEVARALTGWTVMPAGRGRERAERMLARVKRLPRDPGFVRSGEFLFNAEAHDAEEKTILGRDLPAGRGIEDGLEVLDMLADHPSTARHLAHKLAVRFVSDEPPASLVERLAKTFERSRGDLAAVMRTLFDSPELWDEGARHQKIKSPLELAVSSLRALDAEVAEAPPIVDWIRRMGQALYAYQAPTGYPDSAAAWVNTGSLLNRMNFGMQLAARRVPGVAFDLARLNGQREPESLSQALATYASLLMPERELDATLALLDPLVADAGLAQRLEEMAPADAASGAMAEEPAESAATRAQASQAAFLAARPGRGRRQMTEASPAGPVSPLEHVVGVILGSPAFQRR